MGDIHARLADLGLRIPEILLPGPGIDLKKWAVIACDQFTQDRNYWEQVKDEAGNAPSTLGLIFPEVYLEEGGQTAWNKRKDDIRSFMDSCLGMDAGVFAPPRRCGVYLERSTPFTERRRGLVLAIDLERYDWKPETRPLIRATEGTVPERLPPRMRIRRDAPLETSHVLLLIDDEEDTLIPGLGRAVKERAPLYRAPLMMDSGAVSGWALDTEDAWETLAAGLEGLAQKARDRYGVKDKVPFLYAVGDGNHSLATAKAVWEEYKAAHGGGADHPGRYALVELENLHDPGIRFEPIHRVIFGADAGEVAELLSGIPGFSVHGPGREGDSEGVPANIIRVDSHSPDIAAAALEPALERFISQSGRPLSMDYIHGEDELFRVVAESRNSGRKAVGIIFPAIQKAGFFKTIAQKGPLPRKSFSMGEGCEKRFYLECRELF